MVGFGVQGKGKQYITSGYVIPPVEGSAHSMHHIKGVRGP